MRSPMRLGFKLLVGRALGSEWQQRQAEVLELEIIQRNQPPRMM